MRGNLFIISGPSGVGKTTIAKAVFRRLRALQSTITYTTRRKRRAMREDKEIRFVSEAAFRRLIKQGALLEWAVVHGNFYGTDRASLEEHLAAGRSVLLNIDVQGTRQVLRREPRACTIFILPGDPAKLEQRIRARQDIREQDIRERLRNIRRELRAAPRYRHRMVNREGKVDETIATVVRLIRRLHVHR